MWSAQGIRQEMYRGRSPTSLTRCCRRSLGFEPLRVNPAHQAAGSLALHQLILLNEAVEHGGDLSAGGRALRVKQIAGFSLYKTAADRPLHRRLCVIRDLVRVPELVQISLDGQIVALVVCVAVEDGCKLFAGDGIVRAELVFAVARKDAVLRRPCDRVSVPLSGLHIGKAVFALRRGAALHAPENGRHHAARRRPMRTEQGLARAEHQSVFVDEHHIAVEPVLFRNIGKGIRACVRIFVHAPACIHGHILRQINTGNLVYQAAFAVPADKGVSAPGGNILGQVNVGIVRFPHAGNITAAACFKAQRVVGDGWIVAAATAADVGPVGVDGGICREYGIRRNLCAAAFFGVPAVEAVTAASGGAGQRGQLLVGGGHAADRGRTAVAVKGDDELGRRRRRDGALVAANIAGRIRVIGVDV